MGHGEGDLNLGRGKDEIWRRHRLGFKEGMGRTLGKTQEAMEQGRR